jgi:tRNA dimethylallyltransferase
MNEHPTLPLVVIVGPTASGKSALAIRLAQELNGEVIACDSTQLYRGFDIGTAKPNAAERGSVTHHLIDVLDAMEEATAGGYRELAVEVLEGMKKRGCLPILTVGTGLYLRALLEGFAEVPQRSEMLRERLRSTALKRGPGYLHCLLKRLDPISAGKIAAADEQKLIRAIEVRLLAKKPLSEIHRTGRRPLKGWRAVKIGLSPEREELYKRIHARTEAMLACGWLEEVRALVASGLPENAKPFDFIGYRELVAVLKKERELPEASEAIEQATRRYAKRQITWFRPDKEVHWLEGFGDDAEIQRESLTWLRAELRGVAPGADRLDV